MACVAPWMSLQALPFLSQCSHWYENVIGWSPTQEPLPAVSVVPTVAAPAIVGGELLAGTPVPFVISAVGAEFATAESAPLCAVTSKRIVAPKSADVSV